MKSILSNSTVLGVNRCIGFLAMMALATLPAFGAGSAKQAAGKDGDPSITLYNQGVEFMLSKEIPRSAGKI